MPDLLRLRLQGRHEMRMGMPKGVDSDTGPEVEPALTSAVDEPGPLASFEGHVRARERRIERRGGTGAVMTVSFSVIGSSCGSRCRLSRGRRMKKAGRAPGFGGAAFARRLYTMGKAGSVKVFEPERRNCGGRTSTSVPNESDRAAAVEQTWGRHDIC